MNGFGDVGHPWKYMYFDKVVVWYRSAKYILEPARASRMENDRGFEAVNFKIYHPCVEYIEVRKYGGI